MSIPTLKIEKENDYAENFAYWLSKEIKGYCTSAYIAGITFRNYTDFEKNLFLEEQRISIENRIKEAMIGYNKNFAKPYYGGNKKNE